MTAPAPPDLGPLSPIAPRLVRVASAVLGRVPTADDWFAVQAAIENHLDPEAGPSWMLELLDRLLEGRPTPEAVGYPIGYPEGENGFVNVVADVERALGSLGVDDQGEQLSWPLPALGVRLVLFREGDPVYVVRPWSGRFAELRGGRVQEGLLVSGRFVAPRTVCAPDGRLLWTIEVDEWVT